MSVLVEVMGFGNRPPWSGAVLLATVLATDVAGYPTQELHVDGSTEDLAE